MRRSLLTLLPVIALVSPASAARADSFSHTTPGTIAFAVPVGVSSLTVSATGGAGGDLVNGLGATVVAGGRGALVRGTVAVFAGEQLQLTVAASGGNANATTGTSGAGGAPDGAAGGYSAGGGGGATRVTACEGSFCPVAVIAGGGGGAGASGFISFSPTFPALPGGLGGAAGARGTDGASDIASGGSGGQPGTAGAEGTGGAGADAGAKGSGAAGGAGGNATGAFNGHEGGGGGGGGVFGGGGGGSGAMGTDGFLHQEYAGGGGGGGGSSLAPSGASVDLAAPRAAPEIVLTWVAPATPVTPAPAPPVGPAPAPAPIAVPTAAVGRETLSPKRFRAARGGPSAVAAKRRYGAKVSYTLNTAAAVRFTVIGRLAGRRAGGGRCVKPTRANRKARICARLTLLAGGFSRAGVAGTNRFRFTGRLRGRTLKPGSYRLLATVGSGRSASASFQVIR